MPRKKPDLSPWMEGDKRVDSVFARMVYFNQWGENYIIRMKDNPETQRTVKCQECGIVIPRDVPRLAREGSWYRKGHLCVSCAQNEINEFINNMKTLQNEINEHLQLGEALLDCAKEIEQDTRYPDRVAMGKLIQVIGKERRRGY